MVFRVLAVMLSLGIFRASYVLTVAKLLRLYKGGLRPVGDLDAGVINFLTTVILDRFLRIPDVYYTPSYRMTSRTLSSLTRWFGCSLMRLHSLSTSFEFIAASRLGSAARPSAFNFL